MRKIAFIAASLLAVSTTFAQINFGVKAGYNSSLGLNSLEPVTSGAYTLNSVKAEWGNNFHAGVFARFGIKKLYLQPELLYAMAKKDYKVTVEDIQSQGKTVTYDKFVTISTVDVPVLLGYKIIDTQIFNLRAFAGPKFSFKAGSTLEVENLASTTQDKLINDMKNAQVSLEAGAGIDVLMFTLDARYNLIKDMYQTKLGDLTINNIPSNTFVISLGVKF